MGSDNANPVHYLPDDVELHAESTQTLLNVALAAGLPHTHVCGGNARCSTCRVVILEGLENLSPRNDKEDRLCQRFGFDREIRLACQTTVTGRVHLRRLVLDDADLEIVRSQGEAVGAGPPPPATVPPALTAPPAPAPAASPPPPAGPVAVGEELTVAILFADVRSFTAFSESVLPYDVIHVLNRYFRAVAQAIEAEGGFINCYMGDGLMALFGVDGVPDAPMRAVRAALGMLEAVDAKVKPYLNAAYGHAFDIGVGIHFGEAVVGPVGAGPGRAITAIGDAVNFASRIEAANKSAGTRLLISEPTFHAVAGRVHTGRTSRVELKGKTGEHTLYEVTGLADDAKPVR